MNISTNHKQNASIIKYHELAQPANWFEIADELFHSVNLLFKNKGKSIIKHVRDNKKDVLKPTVSKSYFLLAGYTIENLLKCLLIVQTPTLIKNGKIDSSISSGHNLLNLSSKIIDFEFNSEEIELLKTLTEAIPYWGRYPIPKKWQQLKEESILDSFVHELFTLLYHKLREKIYFDTRFGWKGPDGIKSNDWFCSEYEPDFPLEEYKNVDFEEIYKIRREKYNMENGS